MVRQIGKELLQFLRLNATNAERKLWSKLKAKQFYGIGFRFQHPIGPYVVDFYSPKYKLVIELDGDVHLNQNQMKKDLIREQYLQSRGLKVIHFKNEHVVKNTRRVFESIAKNISWLKGRGQVSG